MIKGYKPFTLFILFMLTACTNINHSHTVVANPRCQWGIATFTNNTEVPQAGSRAMSVTAGILRAKGVRALTVYPSDLSCNKLLVCPNAVVPAERIIRWAHHHHVAYVMIGAVNEWDYKVGLDGEPAVAVSLQLYYARTGQLIWSAVGSKIGTSRSGLGLTAQELITQMLSSLRIQ